jgi:UDP-glucuronate decarboxylase
MTPPQADAAAAPDARVRPLEASSPLLRGQVLVTGGAGFIGSHLCARLVREGAAVMAIDDLSTGDRTNLAPLGNGRFILTAHNVADRFEHPCSAIFHLACPASPRAYQRSPIDTVKTAVFGTLHALENAEAYGARMLLASTSEVYGDPQVHPQREDYTGAVDPTGPRACYDEGKRCGETLATEFARQRGVDVRIARIFNTYGPRMQPDDGRVVSNFIMQALTGQPLTVYGDGSQTRSLCYVSDLIEGLLRLMDSPLDAGPVNLGNPQEITVLELAERILRLTRSRSRIAFKPLPRDDPRRRRPDITRARTHLNWQPQVPLEEGLERTVHWFMRQVDTGGDSKITAPSPLRVDADQPAGSE